MTGDQRHTEPLEEAGIVVDPADACAAVTIGGSGSAPPYALVHHTYVRGAAR